jgi:hypothetical protein
MTIDCTILANGAIKTWIRLVSVTFAIMSLSDSVHRRHQKKEHGADSTMSCTGFLECPSLVSANDTEPD